MLHFSYSLFSTISSSLIEDSDRLIEDSDRLIEDSDRVQKDMISMEANRD